MSSAQYFPDLRRGRIQFLCLFLCLFLLSACGGGGITGRFANNLSRAILNNNDPETVRLGGPAYLLMTDSLLAGDPENKQLLRAGADIYGAYSDIYVKEPERAKRLTQKSLEYALRAMCASDNDFCNLRGGDFQRFESRIRRVDDDEISLLFSLGSSWASWIQARKEDWNAVAEIARVEAVMRRVIAMDESYRDGAAHLYLGILATLLPPAMGGKPEEGRSHFERALQLSGNRNLMVKVLYAQHYARLTFNRELHDGLLREVIAARPATDGYTLGNTLAQERAKELLESAEDYF